MVKISINQYKADEKWENVNEGVYRAAYLIKRFGELEIDLMRCVSNSDYDIPGVRIEYPKFEQESIIVPKHMLDERFGYEPTNYEPVILRLEWVK